MSRAFGSVPHKEAEEPEALAALRAWLAQHRVERFFDALADTLGAECVDDMRFLREDDLAGIGMRVVERRRLLEVAAEREFLRPRAPLTAALTASKSAASGAPGARAEAGSDDDEDSEAPGRTPLSQTQNLSLPRRAQSGPQDAPAGALTGADLIKAVRRKDVEAVKAALDAGVDIEFKDSEYNQTALSWACEAGAEALVPLLLERRANPNTTAPHGYTPLHDVIRRSTIACVVPLLEAGADVMALNEFGATPMHHAAKYGVVSAVAALIKHGAGTAGFDLDVPMSAEGDTPLHYAAQHDHGSIVKMLLRAGASADKERVDGSTALHLAAEHSNEECVAALLQHGAAVGVANKAELTPLHVAAKEGHEDVLSLLLTHAVGTAPAVIDQPAGLGDKRATALHLAVMGSYEECVATLIEHGVDLNAQDVSGNTPLHLAARDSRGGGMFAFSRSRFGAGDGDSAIVAMLVEAGARLDIANLAGRTPLGVASNADIKKQLTRQPAQKLPEDLLDWLTQTGFAAHADNIVRKLELTCLADVRHVQPEDLEDVPMPRIERRRFMETVRRYVVGSTEVTPGVAGAPAYDIMISYRVSETGDGGDGSALRLAAALRSLDYSVFVGEAAIQATDIWPRTIQAGVENSAAFVALCSSTYGDETVSPWTFREMTLASSLKKPIIPVWHSGAYPPTALKIYFGTVQRIPGGVDDMRACGVDGVLPELVATLQRLGVAPSGGVRRAPSSGAPMLEPTAEGNGAAPAEG